MYRAREAKNEVTAYTGNVKKQCKTQLSENTGDVTPQILVRDGYYKESTDSSPITKAKLTERMTK